MKLFDRTESNVVHVNTLINLKEKYHLDEVASVHDGACELIFTIWTGDEKCYLTYPVLKNDAFLKIDVLNMTLVEKKVKLQVESKNKNISLSTTKKNSITETIIIPPVYNKGQHFTYRTPINNNMNVEVNGTIVVNIDYKECNILSHTLNVEVKVDKE